MTHKIPPKQPQTFFPKSYFFKMTPKKVQIFWQNLLPKTFKIHPIWSHCISLKYIKLIEPSSELCILHMFTRQKGANLNSTKVVFCNQVSVVPRQVHLVIHLLQHLYIILQSCELLHEIKQQNGAKSNQTKFVVIRLAPNCPLIHLRLLR